ncbi:MAG: glycosyltransferase, partial [Candidatus Poribacteria bacterium]|nr:glycosyltransferase [Candidatus Poribacteria bacterium]
PQPKRKDHPVHLLFSARFVEKKGLMDALEAVLMTRATHKNFAFKIIGSGPLEAEATRFIAENDMKDYVSLLGFLPYEDYLREMRSADIFLQSSKTARNGDSEGGAPTTILEAQATGKPVIATRHADIPNIVVENKSALLSDEGDRDGLSNNIISLLNRQDEWVAMGAAGRAFVEKYHNIDTEIINLEEKYHRLLSMGSTVFQK